MILSQMINRGTLKGMVQRSAPQDYEDLLNLPGINGNTLIGDKGGHDLGLANLTDIPTVPGVMQGATASTDGAAGQAPQPLAGEQNKFLAGDGSWKEIITGIDYSTQEQDTGVKWIDGKNIYRRVFDLHDKILNDNTWNYDILNISNLYIIELIGFFGLSGNTSRFPFSYYRSPSEYFTYYINASGQVDVRPNMNSGTLRGDIVIIYYTKNS